MFNNSRQEPLPLTDSFINQDRYTIDDLIEIMAFLRSDRGCPWDREQTHASLRKNLLEEAYEAIDAIDSGIPDKLCEELGDVLLQVVLHAQLATEAEQFDFNDVVQGICRKMISRHTHIFGQDRAASSGEAIDTWEKNKLVEKGHTSQAQVLQDVPRVLPALHRSFKVQQKAARVGFDWDDAGGPLAKINEELEEIRKVWTGTQQAVAEGEMQPEIADRQVAGEVGDFLFAAVNYARHLNVQPEMALNQSTEKFIRRFSRVEELAGQRGFVWNEMSLATMDQLWEQVKEEEQADEEQ
ncbi:MAG: nucleoside triphosphate pyrophosphohydrolase [Clostridiaceae bacterium]|jgi:tetrapyrrole methylase family protein/MazG family protein|nr:nucleoside triphosphate pyrophosphohydrolase [Clostridiaceae bacterium]